MHRKLRLYQEAGIKEYWVIDPEQKLIEAYRLNNGHYEPYILGIDDTLRSALFADLAIPVKTIFE
ncbi:MAG: Uma2 family endonuclease, partial [Treponema sp.]|jgi:Uma2 family endonuclease|nr:Uma2 family endonuclease [Treponema sp.]